MSLPDASFMTVHWDQPEVTLGLVALGCRWDEAGELHLLGSDYLVSKDNPVSPCGGYYLQDSQVRATVRTSLCLDESRLDAAMHAILIGVEIIDGGASRFVEIKGALMTWHDHRFRNDWWPLDRMNPDCRAVDFGTYHRVNAQHPWVGSVYDEGRPVCIRDARNLTSYSCRKFLLDKWK